MCFVTFVPNAPVFLGHEDHEDHEGFPSLTFVCFVTFVPNALSVSGHEAA